MDKDTIKTEDTRDMKTLFILITLSIIAFTVQSQSAEEYSISAASKFKLKDFNGAINDYTCVLELNPSSAETYISRGIAKDSLEFYNGAITDYTSAIEIEPTKSIYYFYRGKAKYKRRLYSLAILDYNKAIEIDPSNAVYYYAKGLAKANLGQDVCVDFGKAAKLGNQEANEFYKKYCD